MFVPKLATAALFALAPLASAKPLLPQVNTADAISNARAVGGNVPKMVIYTDDYIGGSTGLPTADQLKGFNVLILAFLMTNGAQDQAAQWATLSSSQRQSVLKDYKNAGITLMVSAFGSTDAPTSNGVDATKQGQTDSAWVKKWGLAGIDVDYEDMNAMNQQNGKAEQWLIDYTKALRAGLPSSQGYFISHAPVSPWFSAAAYKTGAYVTVHKKAGDDIDWYNMQFYNQGNSEYTTCQGLITSSSDAFPDTALLQINAKAGVPFNKIVIGKPSAAGQASNGYISPETLSQCIAQAGAKGWNGGAMFWEFENNMSVGSLIDPLVKAFEALSNLGSLGGLLGGGTSNVGGGDSESSSSVASSAAPTSTAKGGKQHASSTSSAAATPSSTSSSSSSSDDGDNNDGDDGSSSDDGSDASDSGSCDGAKAWSADAVYDGGSAVGGSSHTVSYQGWSYQNKWWTQGDVPSENSGGDGQVWTKLSACNNSKKREVQQQQEAAGVIANVTRRSRAHHGNKMRRVRSSLVASEILS